MTAALVIDTNFVMSNKSILDQLKSLSTQYNHKLIIPYTVVQELDHLKSPILDNMSYKQRQVRAAISWVYDQLANLDHRVAAQAINDVLQPGLRGDDSILDCCRWFQQEKGYYTVLLSNDKNLCNKAIIHGIPTVTYKEGMTARSIAEKVFEASRSLKDHKDIVDLSMSPKQFDKEIEAGKENQNDHDDIMEMDVDVSMDNIGDNLGDADTQALQVSPVSQVTRHLGSLDASKYASVSPPSTPASPSLPGETHTDDEPLDVFEALKSRIEQRLSQVYDPDELQYMYKEPQDLRDVYHVIRLFKVSEFRRVSLKDLDYMKAARNDASDPVWRIVYKKL